MSIFISVISGNSFLHDGRFFKFSSVKTHWNCSFYTLAFAPSGVAGKPEHILRGMPVSSKSKMPVSSKSKRI